jgi:hypothetical protein
MQHEWPVPDRDDIAWDADGDRPAIWVPYGEHKLETGDAVYCVGVRAGALHLFGRIVVGRIAPDHDHIESVHVWEEPGTRTRRRNKRVVPEAVVDALIYRYADGRVGQFVRRSGAVQATPFQGRASIRRLASGYELLDRIADE